MNDMNEKDVYEDFLKSILSYAVVIRADIATIQELKEYIAKKNIDVAFQKISTNKLFIKEVNNDI